MKDDLISREAAIETVKKLLYETAFNSCGHHQDDEIYSEIAENRIRVWLGLVPSVPAVPLVTLLKFIEQTEHFTYPPCQNEIEKCRDCKLHYTFGSQKECWKQFLTKWMEEQDAAD